MVTNYATLKVTEDTIQLLEKAKEVFLSHHQALKGFRISRDKVINRALTYYIEN